MTARRVDRPGRLGGGYEIADDTGRVVETGEFRLDGTLFSAWADDPAGGPPVRRVGSRRPGTDGVLAWLSEHGPAGGAR